MAELNSPDESRPGPNRRATHGGNSILSGIDSRIGDSEPTKALHSIAVLFRVMSGLLILLMLVQVMLGVTSTVEISVGVLFGEAIRLVIFAGLLWAAGDLADLFIKSQGDIRTTRILLSRLAAFIEQSNPDRRGDDAANQP